MCVLVILCYFHIYFSWCFIFLLSLLLVVVILSPLFVDHQSSHQLQNRQINDSVLLLSSVLAIFDLQENLSAGPNFPPLITLKVSWKKDKKSKKKKKLLPFVYALIADTKIEEIWRRVQLPSGGDMTHDHINRSPNHPETRSNKTNDPRRQWRSRSRSRRAVVGVRPRPFWR